MIALGAKALIFNNNSDLLVLKPSYRDHWVIPGGIVDGGESPSEACKREVFEEIAIKVGEVKLICIVYSQANSKREESVEFIFSSDVFNTLQESTIRVDGKEIEKWQFVSLDKALNLFKGSKRNLEKIIPICLGALKEGKQVYLED